MVNNIFTSLMKYELDNGWEVWKEDGVNFLEVTPLENSIFSKYALIKIPNHIFLDIANGERNVKELFRKHKLHNLIIKWKPSKKVEFEKIKGRYYGGGWFVEKNDNKYFLEFMSSQQGGRSIRKEISKEVFLDFKTSKSPFSELRKKHNIN